MTHPASQPVHQFKNGRQLIRTCISTFRGRARIDLRLWLETPEGLVPTRQGVSILVEQLPALKAAIAAAEAALPPNRQEAE